MIKQVGALYLLLKDSQYKTTHQETLIWSNKINSNLERAQKSLKIYGG